MRAIAALAILLALAVIGVRVAMLQVPERREELQAMVGRATGLDIRLQKLKARWSIGGPEIYATGVEVYVPNGGPRLARARAVSISTDLKRMLLRRELKSGRIRLIGPEVRVVRTATGLQLEGQSLLHRAPDKGPMNSDAIPNGSLQIEDGRLTVLDGVLPAGAAGAQPEVWLKLQGLRFSLQRDRDAVKFAGDLRLPQQLGGLLQFSGSASGRLDDPRHLQWQLTAAGHELQLDAWQQFLSGRWQGLHPRGRVQALNVAFASSGLQPPSFKVAAWFSAVGIDPVERVPGLRGLSGELHATEKSGQARLTAANFSLSMPYRFREPILADSAAATLDWSRDESGAWHLLTRGAQASSPYGSAVADLEVTLPADGSSRLIKLHGRFQNGEVKEAWRYLPVDRLSNPATLAWLDEAFRAGRVVSGEVSLEGPMRSFPFRNGEGEFRVTCTVEDATLRYGRGWPDLEHVDADLEFHNAGLTGTLLRGQLNGLQIAAGARADIPDLRLAELTVNGKVSGDLGAALAYLQSSPLGPGLGSAFQSLRGGGPMTAQLDLFFPVKQRDARKYTLVADFGGSRGADRLTLEGSAHELRALRGRLSVQDKQLTARGLKASYLGGPVSIDLRPEIDRRTRAVDNVAYVQGQTSAAALAQQFAVPEKVTLAGTVDWRATARVAAKTAENSPPVVTVQIDSSLEGTAVNLPAPLGKSALESRPLRLSLQWPQADVAQVRARYGSLLQAQMSFTKAPASAGSKTLTSNRTGDGQNWQFDRGVIRLGGGRVRAPSSPGMQIEGTADKVDLAGWLALRSGKPGNRPLSDYLRGMDLRIREVQLYGFRLPDVAARLTAQATAWSIEVAGPRSQGTVSVPFDLEGAQPLVIDMALLDLGDSQSSGDEHGGGAPDPRRWPAVRVSVRDFSAWNKHLGFTVADLTRAPDGLLLKAMSARGADFELTGSGGWKVTPAGQGCTLALKIESSDVQQTLLRLGYGGSLAGKHGQAQLDLHWPGPPDGQLVARLSGALHVEVDDGQLVSVQPGAGRVFGLMSVATLKRRLSLDFSDLTDKGLAFDAIRGDFTLRDGDAYTSNLLLRGPAAEIGIVGRTGLGARDYDQTAVVTGNLGQSLPVAGALAGGPAVGAALLVFSQIFKQPLKGIARGYYRITGPWEDPTVEKIEADELKKAQGSAREIVKGAGAS